MTLVLAAVLQLLVDKAEALEAELRVELLGLLDGLVDQAHTGGVVTTEVGLEAEENDALLILDLVFIENSKIDTNKTKFLILANF